jgi:hypothetical protein
VRISREAAKKLGVEAPKPAKYRNVPVVQGGVRFASKKEARRHAELLLMEKAGAIRDLRRQVPFDLAVNGRLVCRFVADFTYLERGEAVVEDVKSAITRKNPVYALKRKLMLACHGITIRET